MSAGSRLAGLRARWPRWRAEVAWVVDSWRRPAGAEARWEQGSEQSRRRSERERRPPRPRRPSRGW